MTQLHTGGCQCGAVRYRAEGEVGGAWTTLVGGFGGLRDDEGVLSLNPHLPDGIFRLRFRLRWRGFRLTVDANHADVTYTLRDGPGESLTIWHADEELTLNTGSPSTIAIAPRKPLLPPPPQPPGCAPTHRRSTPSQADSPVE